MTPRRIETPLGPIEFHGRDTGKPVQLGITSAFASVNRMTGLQEVFPGQDVWRAHLPGNHCPALVTTSVGAFGFAFSHALRQVLRGRKATIVGVSAGALTAMAIDQDLVRGMVLADPPLRPSSAWPFLTYRETMPQGGEAFVWNLFGIGPQRIEARDYSGLVDRLRAPTRVLVGAVPLGEPRVLDEMPSLVDDDARARFIANPAVRLDVIPGCGHHVLRDVPRFFAAIRAVS